MAAILAQNVPAGLLSTAPDAQMQKLVASQGVSQMIGQEGAALLGALGGSPDPAVQDAISGQLEVAPRDQGLLLAAPSTRSLPPYLRTSDADLYRQAERAAKGNNEPLKRQLYKEYQIRKHDKTLGLPGSLPMTPRSG